MARARRSPLWLVAPAALITAFILCYPLIYNAWISLHVNRLSPDDGKYVGLANYRDILRFTDFSRIVANTLWWTAGSMALQFVLGLSLALLLDLGLAGSRYIRGLLLVSWVMPGVVTGMIWLAIYSPLYGVGNALVGVFGLSARDWLGTPATALPSVILANVWKGFPFWMLMISAGLKSVPQELYDAARVDGASYLRTLTSVTLPHLKNILVLTSILAFIWTFNYFDLVYTLTRGGPGDETTILPLEIYYRSFEFNRFDQGAVLSVTAVAMMLVAIVAYMRAVRLRTGRPESVDV